MTDLIPSPASADAPSDLSFCTSLSPLTRGQSVRLLAAVLVTVLGTFGLAAVVLLVVPGARSVGLTILGAALPIGSALALYVIHRNLRRAGTGWRALGFVRPTARILHLLWQFPTLLLLLVTAQGLVLVITGSEPAGSGANGVNSLFDDANPVLAVTLALAICVLTPLWEEATFRGVIHGGLRHRFGLLAASLLSGAIFAVAHGVPILLPYMVVLGLSLAFLREFHRTLWAPVIAHVLLNSLVTGGVLIAALS